MSAPSKTMYALRYRKNGMLKEFPMKRFRSLKKAKELAREIARQNKCSIYITIGTNVEHIVHAPS